MSCDRFESMIALDAGGDLPAADGERLARHLVTCADCRCFAEEMRDSRRAVALLTDVPVDEEVLAAVRARVLREVASSEDPRRIGRTGPTGPTPWPSRTVATRALALAATLAVALGAWLLLRTSPVTPPGVTSEPEAPAPRVAEVPARTPLDTVMPPAAPEPVASEPVAVEPSPSVPVAVATPVPPTRPAERVAAARTPSASTTQQPPKPSPPVTVSPRTPPAKPVAAMATAATTPESTAEPMVIKLVSDEADVVIYWLVQPSQAGAPSGAPSKETKDEISAV